MIVIKLPRNRRFASERVKLFGLATACGLNHLLPFDIFLVVGVDEHTNVDCLFQIFHRAGVKHAELFKQ
jgi:hypothetical protein